MTSHRDSGADPGAPCAPWAPTDLIGHCKGLEFFLEFVCFGGSATTTNNNDDNNNNRLLLLFTLGHFERTMGMHSELTHHKFI